VTANTDHVQRLLGHAELGWIIQRSRRRLEHGQPLQGPIVLARASQGQRRAVERLLGRAVAPGLALSVRLESVQLTLLRAGAATDLRSAIEALTGPVVDRRADRTATERAWAEAFAPLEAISARRPILDPWLASVRSTGLLRRLARGDAAAGLDLAEAAARIVERLPCRAMPLSVLASSVAGDGHSLDAGRPLCSLVIRAAGRVGDVPEGHDAEWRRTVWASVGVLSGELTSPVLCLNLPVHATTAAGRALAGWAEVGQPVYLTARQLLRDPPPLHPLRGRCVYVCENPTVVAEAANVVGSSSAPLVCASGHPAGAATVLLRQLAESGANLRYHGDFDWPGITIANGLFARFGVGPWQFDAAAYRAAARSGGSLLRGRAVQAAWDSELTEAMLILGRKIEEEQVLASLLADLARAE
jgi:uncharacterized protein (TIGR02679 family)